MHIKKLLDRLCLVLLFWFGLINIVSSQSADEITKAIEHVTLHLHADQNPAQILPTLNLTKIDDNSNVSKNFYGPSWGGGGWKEFPVSSVRPSPDGVYWLLSHGDGHTLFNNNKNFITAVPQISRKNTTPINWYWKTLDTLVGVAIEHKQYPNADIHINTDMPTVASFFFLYSLKQNKLYVLKTPQPQKGNIVRLDGITENGALFFSEADDYYGEIVKHFGVFDFSPESLAELEKDKPK